MEIVNLIPWVAVMGLIVWVCVLYLKLTKVSDGLKKSIIDNSQILKILAEDGVEVSCYGKEVNLRFRSKFKSQLADYLSSILVKRGLFDLDCLGFLKLPEISKIIEDYENFLLWRIPRKNLNSSSQIFPMSEFTCEELFTEWLIYHKTSEISKFLSIECFSSTLGSEEENQFDSTST